MEPDQPRDEAEAHAADPQGEENVADNEQEQAEPMEPQQAEDEAPVEEDANPDVAEQAPEPEQVGAAAIRLCH